MSTTTFRDGGLLSRILLDGGGLGSEVRVGAGIFGDPRDRPIGMRREGDSYVFSPQCLRLNFADADEASRTDFRSGIGVIPIYYVDDAGLQGNYVIYVQIQRLY